MYDGISKIELTYLEFFDSLRVMSLSFFLNKVSKFIGYFISNIIISRSFLLISIDLNFLN